MRSEDKRAAGERLGAALFASFVLHALFFILTPRHMPPEPLGPITDLPLNVTLASPQSEPAPEAQPPPRIAAAPTPTRPRPVNRPPTPLPPRFPPNPFAPPTAAPKVPLPEPAPRPEPPVDMMAAIEARRAQRRSADAAMARGAPSQAPVDAAARNLETLSGHEGVGGVFQILRKSRLSGEFAFNGFRNEGQRRWREVIEVNTTPDVDIDLAIVRRMIELIRTHYSGDFQWDSQRLGRVVVLSARPVDQPGLEEFLIKEFFGTPVEKNTRREPGH